MKEEYRRLVIDGHPFDYEVSNLGNVRSLKTGKILKGRPGSNGYLRIGIYDASINYAKDKGIHQLVMLMFNPSPNKVLEINHKNGDKCDNRLSNLEWVTHKENMSHAKEFGLYKRGEDSPHSKYNEQDVRRVCELLQDGKRQKVVSKETGVSFPVVRAIYLGRIWRHISKDYDFSRVPRYTFSQFKNSLDRLILFGEYSRKRAVLALMEKGLTKDQANDFIDMRMRVIKKGKSVVQTDAYVDDGIELF